MRSIAAGLAAAALLAACGGGGGGTAQPSGSVRVTLADFKFDPATLSVPNGKVVFYLVNNGSVSHDMIIRDSGGNRVAGSDLVSPGDALVFTVASIPAGTYTYFCDQPGHEQSGMHGTLTVT